MKRYDAVICDMFDTIVNFRWDRLPFVPFDGGEVRSSGPLVYEAIQTVYSAISRPEFCRAFIEASQDAEAIRAATRREITASQRFGMLLRGLGIEAGPIADAIMGVAIPEQMRRLRVAMECPEENRTALDMLRAKYRLAVVSNFDHGPTVEAALADFGIRDWFDAIVVSADVGWRKPHPAIFREVFRRMGIEAEQAIFVGDTPDADVLGAQAVGMDTIWIDRGCARLPADADPPTRTVSKFGEIVALL